MNINELPLRFADRGDHAARADSRYLLRTKADTTAKLVRQTAAEAAKRRANAARASGRGKASQ